MTQIFLRPARPGLVVLRPEQSMARLADDGDWVELDPYYIQLIRHGDLIMDEPEPEADAPEPEPEAAPKRAARNAETSDSSEES